MLISELNNRDDVLSAIIKELNGVGIKIRNERKKISNNKKRNRKIFNVSLHLMELDDGLLSNGSVTQIPKFVLMACKRIQAELETEGLFRKTGSVKQQKIIQDHLEKGGIFDKNHHVIDVANLLKTFFRQLPEPLIPPGPIQEALLRCLFHFKTYEEKCEALLMLMLLLPPISVNTLAYFLQFLEVVVKNSKLNLMTADNLVKVLTPTIMPVPLNSPPQRLNSHFKVMELLIENANLLGVVPDRMLKKENFPFTLPLTEERKKKKRRSGSLNRVFHGFRKIVGAIGSSENLDVDSNDDDPTLMTPNVTKSTKKRRLEKFDLTSNSSKKKKDLMMTLSALPEIDSPPNAKNDINKTRKSLGSHDGNQQIMSPNKRRWSIVGSKFSRNNKNSKQATVEMTNNENTEEVHTDDDYVKISKSEYEAFKDRLISIETKLTHEFNETKLDTVKAEFEENDQMNGPEKVQNKYHQTLQEIEKLEESERNTEHLARRLSRDLKIRPNVDHAIVRSPSARKIGSLRRRRDSTTRLLRNQSWHLGQTSPKPILKKSSDETISLISSTSSFYPKSNLKRAKPVQRPLPALPPSPEKQQEKIIPEKPLRNKRKSSEQFSTPLKIATVVVKPAPEIWTSATDFFDEKQINDEMIFKTPIRVRRISAAKSTCKDEVKTPMLPPRTTPAAKKFTPISATTTPKELSAFNKHFGTPLMSSEGRESIIAIRNKNAGMVAQKAKLFNGMLDIQNSAEKSVKIPRVIVNKNLENVKNMSFNEKRKIPSNSMKSPRRSPRSSPGGISKRQQLKSSPLLKTIRECSESQKVKLLRPEILNEVASPKPKSLSTTPRRPL
ncbi:CLUMA_CG016346, isoform A [Clunio marinus]|uniref:CLUMA_CG016346, isoform A n=1 Tax=Clunio marinus TaxID=568069 RepID=A0A1J1ITV5_9DIPT|nr:CLUMA_CG016346, isoform A [Clunio marinus]